MTEGKIAPLLIRFSIPLLIGNIIQQFYQVVDMLVVGNYIDDGGIALAAVGSGTSFINMTIGFFVGLSTGAGILASRFYGAGDQKGLRLTTRLSLVLACVIGLALTALSIAVLPGILIRTNTPEAVRESADLYLRIYYVGLVPLLVYNMGTAVLQAIGNSETPLCILLLSSGLNVALDIFFTRDLGLGVAGVGIATVIAEISACFMILAKLCRLSLLEAEEKNDFRFQSTERSGPETDGSIDPDQNGVGWIKIHLKRIFSYGLPIGFQQLTINFSNLLIQSYVNLLGTGFVAAWAIFNRLDGFILLPTFSFGVAITTFTSQNIGAGRSSRLKQGQKVAMLLACVITVILSGALLLWGGSVARLFTGEAEVLDLTSRIICRLVPLYFLLAVIKVYSGILSGAGYTLSVMFLTVGNLCLLRVLLLYLFSGLYAVDILVVYGAYWMSWSSCAVGFTWYLRHKMKEIVREEFYEQYE